MSTKNNKNLATEALLEMEQITSAIKEESKKSINVLLAEAVKDALRNTCNEEEDEYEIEDNEEKDANDNIEDSQDSNSEEDASMESDDNSDSDESYDEKDAQEASENDEGDEWSEFSKYQVGDNAYDLTGENDYENVVKVYKLLTGDDQVVVKQDGNIVQLKDDSVGTEYVIDLGTDDGDSIEVETGEENFDSLDESILGPDDPDFWPTALRRNQNAEELDSDFQDVNADDSNDIAGFESEKTPEKRHHYVSDKELDSIFNGMDDEDDDEYGIESYDDEIFFESKKVTKNKIKENRKAKKLMKESKEVLFEVDLGYTDNYQDKDPIAGLSNNEPSKSGKSWHKGVPTGTEKPWAGKAKTKSEPFATTISEEEMIDEPMVEEPMEEGATTVSSQSVAKTTKTKTSAPRANNARQVAKLISTAEGLVAENKQLRQENKELKEAILAIRKNLTEAYVTNANLGKITKLFLENTTSQAEKIDIVNRFSNEAKTIEESKALYESIKRELNKPINSQRSINESMTTANSNIVNEEKTYKSNDILKTIDFMNRVLKY